MGKRKHRRECCKWFPRRAVHSLWQSLSFYKDRVWHSVRKWTGMRVHMQTQTDWHACFQNKARHQCTVSCMVLGSSDKVYGRKCHWAVPFRTGQAQFQLGLLQPVLHFSNSKTQKWARAFYTGPHTTCRQRETPLMLLWGGAPRYQPHFLKGPVFKGRCVMSEDWPSGWGHFTLGHQAF